MPGALTTAPATASNAADEDARPAVVTRPSAHASRGPTATDGEGAQTILPVISGSALYRAVLDGGGWSNRPDISKRLAKLGDRTHAMETTALRVPLWRTSASGQWPRPVGDGPTLLYGLPVVVAGEARAKDLPLVIAWSTRYIANGCPADGRVEWTFEEAAKWLGYKDCGGRQIKLIRQAVRRIRSAVLEQVAIRTGPGSATPLDRGYGFIDDYGIRSGRGAGRQWVTLNTTLTSLLRLGRVTYLDDPSIRELQRRDEVALRVWLFFETEAGPSKADGFFYRVFPAPDAPDPSISELAWLAGAKRNVLQRLRRAMKVLSEVDPRYSITINRRAILHVTKHGRRRDQDVRTAVLETYEPQYLKRTNRSTSPHHKRRSTNVVSKTYKSECSEPLIAETPLHVVEVFVSELGQPMSGDAPGLQILLRQARLMLDDNFTLKEVREATRAFKNDPYYSRVGFDLATIRAKWFPMKLALQQNSVQKARRIEDIPDG